MSDEENHSREDNQDNEDENNKNEEEGEEGVEGAAEAEENNDVEKAEDGDEKKEDEEVEEVEGVEEGEEIRQGEELDGEEHDNEENNENVDDGQNEDREDENNDEARQQTGEEEAAHNEAEDDDHQEENKEDNEIDNQPDNLSHLEDGRQGTLESAKYDQQLTRNFTVENIKAESRAQENDHEHYDLEAECDDVDEEPPRSTLKKKKVDEEDVSEFNVELNANNEFLNLSRFDEASKAGFTQDHNINFIKKKKQNEDDVYPTHGNQGRQSKPLDGVEKLLSSVNFDTESIDENIEYERNREEQLKQEKNKQKLKANHSKKPTKHDDIKVKDYFEDIPIDDDKIAPFPTIPENFKREPFVPHKEKVGPFQLNEIEMMDKFNHVKGKGLFKRYMKKYENTDSNILKCLTGMQFNANLNLDKNAYSNFIKHKNSSTALNKKADIIRTLFSTVTDKDLDDVELEGYSEQIMGNFKNTIHETDGMNMEDTLKRLVNLKMGKSGYNSNPFGINESPINLHRERNNDKIVNPFSTEAFGSTAGRYLSVEENDKLNQLELDFKNTKEREKTLEEENAQIKSELDRLKEELEIANEKMNTKVKEVIDYKVQNDNLLFDDEVKTNKILEIKQQNQSLLKEKGELEDQLKNTKDELGAMNDMNRDLFDKNSRLKTDLENLQAELNTVKVENSKRGEKIKELQQELTRIEQENYDLKLQSKTDQISLRDTKQNYENLKLTYFDLKNQNEIINMKFEELSEDSFNLKKDFIKLERESKIQRETIDKLRSELLEDKARKVSYDENNYGREVVNTYNSNLSYQEEALKTENYNSYKQDKLDKQLERTVKAAGDYKEKEKTQERENREKDTGNARNNPLAYNDQFNMSAKSRQSIEFNEASTTPTANFNTLARNAKKAAISNKQIEEVSEKAFIGKQMNKKTNFKPDHLSTDLSMLPSQKLVSEKENKVVEIEVKLCEVQKQKDKIQSDLNKMPEFPKTKIQITKKRELELNLQEVNKEVSKYKQALRELNAVNREF